MNTDPILDYLLAWADARETVRAVIVTSTRTMPGATLDPFSDYDIILAVTDVRPYFEDRGWLGDFGPVLAVYRDPIRTEHGSKRFAYITQYETEQLKIDFTVLQADWLRQVAVTRSLPDELDVGYRVLLDKDGLTSGLQPPTHRAHIPTPPTEAEYMELTENLFSEAAYVAKALWRDDLLPAKHCLDHIMKGKMLRIALEWLVEIEHDWSLKPGAIGKGLKKHVPREVWAKLERTYVGADPADNWDAMFATIELFREVAVTVSEHLGYTYPDALHQRALVYLRGVQAMTDVRKQQ